MQRSARRRGAKRAIAIDRATLSLGCIGARTYAELKPEEMLIAIPFSQLEEATERLSRVVDANQKLAAYHAEQRRTIADRK